MLATGSYYDLLQVTSDSPRSELRRNYYEFVRKFHPDLHMNRPERTQTLQKLMETVTLAYKTLTDDTERHKYDEKLAQGGSFALGGQESDAQKTAEGCLAKARECSKAMNYGGAILWMRKAVALEPGSARYRAILARSLSSVAQFRREAMAQLQKAEELDPWNVSVHLQLGELYGEMNLPWRAREHYKKVLEVDADNKKAHKALAELDANSGGKEKQDDGQPAVSQILDINPHNNRNWQKSRGIGDLRLDRKRNSLPRAPARKTCGSLLLLIAFPGDVPAQGGGECGLVVLFVQQNFAICSLRGIRPELRTGGYGRGTGGWFRFRWRGRTPACRWLFSEVRTGLGCTVGEPPR